MKSNPKQDIESIYQEANLYYSDFQSIKDLLEFVPKKYKDSFSHLLCILFHSLNNGSIGINLDEKNLEDYLIELDVKNTKQILKSISNINFDECSQLVGFGENEYKPIIKTKNGEKEYLYFYKYYHYEMRLKKLLKQFATQADKVSVETNALNSTFNEVLKQNPTYIQNKPVIFNEEQVKALEVSIQNKFSIISGGPGTGKTTVIVGYLRTLVRIYPDFDIEKIILIAPTGRASRRMKESLFIHLSSIQPNNESDNKLYKVNSDTIHGILKYNPSTDEPFYHSGNKLLYQYYIIDEVSMVDLALFVKLLEAIPENSIIILLGDKDQLPSIHHGAILSDLIPKEPNSHLSKNIVMLKESNRSKNNDIYSTSQDLISINKNDSKEIIKFIQNLKDKSKNNFQWSNTGLFYLEDKTQNQDTFSFVKLHELLNSYTMDVLFQKNIQKFITLLDSIYKAGEDIFLNDSIFIKSNSILSEMYSILSYSKILCFNNSGSFGVEGINQYISNQFFQTIKKYKKDFNRYNQYYTGIPILITQNDKNKNLFNGDMGFIIEHSGKLYALFPAPDGYLKYPIYSLPTHEIAYSITVHKSQGSEYDTVFVVLPREETNKLLTKEIIYTAITRAKSRVLIYGSESVLQTSISKKIKRESGIQLF